MFGCVLLAFGLLLWARLIVVTNHPRSAIAEPPLQRSVVQPSNGKPVLTDKQDAVAEKQGTEHAAAENDSAHDAAKP
jgi:hypothetical protein